MPYVKDDKGIIHQRYGMCAGCGRTGEFSHSIYVAGVLTLGQRKPLAVYVCADCK